MLRYLKWGFHPVVLILGSILLVLAAGVVVLPWQRGGSLPVPLPVRPGEQEIVWLYPATSTTTWERFATAVQQASDRLQEHFPGLEWEQDESGSSSATRTPQIALSWPAGNGRLV